MLSSAGVAVTTTPSAILIVQLFGLKLSFSRILDSLLAVFTRSTIIPPKVNRFGRNLECCEPNVGAGHGRLWA